MERGRPRPRRRYRLRSKSRFFFGMAALLLCASGAALVAAKLWLMTTQGAMGQRGKPQQLVSSEPQGGGGSSARPRGTDKSTVRPQATVAGNGSFPRASEDWRLALVNETHPLPKGFRVHVRKLPNGLSIDSRVYDDLMRMIGDGEARGLSFVICSAYRSSEKQEELFTQQISAEQKDGRTYEQAKEIAKTKVALPGTSEHNLGLAADIVALNYQKLDEGYLDTAEYKWLAVHCSEYGFIVRYPQGKSAITKIIFEPWHFRYVGREAAAEIMQKGLCLEEYLGEED